MKHRASFPNSMGALTDTTDNQTSGHVRLSIRWSLTVTPLETVFVVCLCRRFRRCRLTLQRGWCRTEKELDKLFAAMSLQVPGKHTHTHTCLCSGFYTIILL